MRAKVRVKSISITDVARISAWTHGALACFGVISMLVMPPEMVTFPVGVLLPVFHLNVNFNVPMPSSASAGIFFALALIVCYLVSGWVTGAFLAACFNLIARFTGGAEASTFTFDDEQSATAVIPPVSLP
jgi:hypothetical protein